MTTMLKYAWERSDSQIDQFFMQIMDFSIPDDSLIDLMSFCRAT